MTHSHEHPADAAAATSRHDGARLEHPASTVDHARVEQAAPEHHDAHGDTHDRHDKHAGHDPEVFRRRFWISLLLTIPVVVFSEMVQDWLGYYTARIPGDHLVAPVLGTVVFVCGGHVFLRGGWHELRARQPGMMLLISLEISVAFVASVATLAGWLALEFWWELAALVTVMLLGHWQEMRALGQTRGALAALIPDDAERITDTGAEHVAVASLSAGDLVLVRPGSRVPADGAIEDGAAEFDESMLTGESRPVPRSAGERVAAGTVVLGAVRRQSRLLAPPAESLGPGSAARKAAQAVPWLSSFSTP